MVVIKLKLVRQQVIKQLRLVIVQLIIKQLVIKQLGLVIVQLIIKQLKVVSEQQLISQLDSIELYQRNDQLEHIRYIFPSILKGYIQFSIRLRNNQSQIVHVGPR